MSNLPLKWQTSVEIKRDGVSIGDGVLRYFVPSVNFPVSRESECLFAGHIYISAFYGRFITARSEQDRSNDCKKIFHKEPLVVGEKES